MIKNTKAKYGILATVGFAAALLLFVLMPSNIIFPIAAFMLGVYLFTKGYALVAVIVSAAVTALAFMLELEASVLLVVPAILITGATAIFCRKMQYRTGKIALISGIAFGVSLAASAVGTVYMLGGKIDENSVQSLYTFILKTLTELVGAFLQEGAPLPVAYIEQLAYSIMLVLPGMILAACATAGIAAALLVARTRNGTRPVIAQITPAKIHGWAFLAGLVLYLLFQNSSVGITGYCLVMLFTPILAIHCLYVLYLGFRMGRARIGNLLILIIGAFTVGPLMALAIGGALFAVGAMKFTVVSSINYNAFKNFRKDDTEMSDELGADIEKDKKEEDTENKSDDTDLRS